MTLPEGLYALKFVCLNPYCNGYGSVTCGLMFSSCLTTRRLNPYCNGYGSVTAYDPQGGRDP